MTTDMIEQSGPTPRTEMKCDRCGGFSSTRICHHCSNMPDAISYLQLQEITHDLTAARQRIEGLEAAHKQYACHGESLLQTLHRLMSAANNHEGNAKGLANQLRDARATATAAESRLAKVEADAAADIAELQYWRDRNFDRMNWTEATDGLSHRVRIAEIRIRAHAAIRQLKEKS